MHSKSDNIEIMINDEADEVIEELFKSLIKNLQIRLAKNQGEVVISYLIVFIYYIINVIKEI